MKFLFAPVGIGAGLVAGMLGKKAFEKLWAVIDEEEPPEPDQRYAPTVKLSPRWRSRARSSAWSKG